MDAGTSGDQTCTPRAVLGRIVVLGLLATTTFTTAAAADAIPVPQLGQIIDEAEPAPLTDAFVAAGLDPALAEVPLDNPAIDRALTDIETADSARQGLEAARVQALLNRDRAIRNRATADARLAVARASIRALDDRVVATSAALRQLAVEDFMGEQRTDRLAAAIDPSVAVEPQRRSVVSQSALDTVLGDRTVLLERLNQAATVLATSIVRMRGAEQAIVDADALIVRLDGQIAAVQDATERANGLVVDALPLSELAGVDFPLVALDAYWRGAQRARAEGCALEWWALAGISRVEGVHGTFGGSRLTAAGDTTRKIIGIALDGNNDTLEILDSDGGRLDGDTTYDRAVGPMQFIPGTWRIVGADGNADGVSDPHNLYDAVAAASDYLCDTAAALDNDAGLLTAYLRYNRSVEYGLTVLSFGRGYEDAIELSEVP